MWEGEEGGRGIQEGGEICIPMADLCWCLAETTQFCRAINLQLKNKLIKKLKIYLKLFANAYIDSLLIFISKSI